MHKKIHLMIMQEERDFCASLHRKHASDICIHYKPKQSVHFVILDQIISYSNHIHIILHVKSMRKEVSINIKGQVDTLLRW